MGHWPDQQVLTFVEGLKGKMFNNHCESAGIICVVRFYANVSILAKFTFTDEILYIQVDPLPLLFFYLSTEARKGQKI